MAPSRWILRVVSVSIFCAAIPARADLDWGESPFLADRGTAAPSDAVSPNAAEEQIMLQGILWDPKAPTAIVNNRVVAPGDRLGRWEVKEIRKDQVILSDGASSRVLQTQ